MRVTWDDLGRSGDASQAAAAVLVLPSSAPVDLARPLVAAAPRSARASLTERAQVRDPDGTPIRFDFADDLPVGLVGFAVTLAVGLAFAMWAVV